MCFLSFKHRVRKLSQDAKSDDRQENDENDQCNAESGTEAPTHQRSMGEIGLRLDAIKIGEILIEDLRRGVALAGITTNGTHDHCSQSWRDLRILVEQRRRIMGN